MIKLITVIDTLGAGGKERRLIELLKGLELQQNIQAELIILSKIVEYEEIYSTKVPIHFIERKSKTDFSIFIKLSKLIKKLKPDIIQSWSMLASFYLIYTIPQVKAKFVNAIVADAPYTLSILDRRWWLTRLSFPFSDKVVGNSNAGLSAYRVPSSKGVCIHNGIDIGRFDNLQEANQLRETIGIKTEYVVGMVASFRGTKDYYTYLEASQRIVLTREDVTFLAVGDGKDLDYYKSNYKHPRIIFTGLHNDVESLANTFTIGVLSTDPEQHGEGISNAIIEYMALGKPVISSDTGGTPELVQHGKTGFIIPPKDVTALQTKILFLLDNPDEQSTMGKNGRAHILEKFTVERMTSDFMKLYDLLL